MNPLGAIIRLKQHIQAFQSLTYRWSVSRREPIWVKTRDSGAVEKAPESDQPGNARVGDSRGSQWNALHCIQELLVGGEMTGYRDGDP